VCSRVIDVGCGSGILSIAALKLGAAYALGVDIDELSVTASRENARANGIADERFILGQGSVQEIMGGKFLPDAAFGSQPIRSAPVVAANILAPVIIRLFQQGLADLVDSKGVLLLSGILEDQVEDVLAAAGTQGMELAEKRQVGDWAALLLMRSAR
jgi:ribosomal protein L11 methyltransferase